MSGRNGWEEWSDAGLVRVSRPVLLSTALLLVLLTGCLMVVLSQVDLDAWLFGPDLALKVGGTSLTLGQFRQLKDSAPPTTRSLGNAEFAAELVETLLLAEAGRQLRLDREEEFIRLREAFDQAVRPTSEILTGSVPPVAPATFTGSGQALPPGSRITGAPLAGAGPATPAADLVRAWFLIEALARMTRTRVADAAVHSVPANPEPAVAPDLAESATPARLHLQTIVVGDEETAREVLAGATAGIPFPVLNASYSRSLYAAVGGDLGWKTAADLPAGVFETLAKLPVGSMTAAYTDAEGVHLLRIKARPAADPLGAARRAAAQAREETRRQAVQRFLQTMRTTMPWWVHPSLARPTTAAATEWTTAATTAPATAAMTATATEWTNGAATEGGFPAMGPKSRP